MYAHAHDIKIEFQGHVSMWESITISTGKEPRPQPCISCEVNKAMAENKNFLAIVKNNDLQP